MDEDPYQLPAARYQELLEYCLREIGGGRTRHFRQVMMALRWLRGEDGLLAPLLRLLREGTAAQRVRALEGLANLAHRGSVGPLIEFLEAQRASESPRGRLLREGALKALATVGGPGSLAYMRTLLSGEEGPEWSESEKALAIEALTLWALEGNREALEVLEGGLQHRDETVVCLSRESMREIHERGYWRARGYATIQADLVREERGEGDE